MSVPGLTHQERRLLDQIRRAGFIGWPRPRTDRLAASLHNKGLIEVTTSRPGDRTLRRRRWIVRMGGALASRSR